MGAPHSFSVGGSTEFVPDGATERFRLQNLRGTAPTEDPAHDLEVTTRAEGHDGVAVREVLEGLGGVPDPLLSVRDLVPAELDSHGHRLATDHAEGLVTEVLKREVREICPGGPGTETGGEELWVSRPGSDAPFLAVRF